MKKTILIMINSLEIGGAEKSLSSLLSLFDYERYDVYLQMINRGGKFEKLLPEQVQILPSIPFFDFCTMPLVKQVLSCNIRYLKARIKTHNELRKNAKTHNSLHSTQAFWAGTKDAFDMLPEKFDVAIAWGQGTPTHFVAEKVKAKRKLAWINADYEAVGHNQHFDLSIYKEYDFIVCVSDGLAVKMARVFPMFTDKVATIYDINSNKLIQRLSKAPFDFPSLHGTVITTVGRLVQLKGYDIAVKAAHLLKEKGINYTWLVCGEGPERKAIEENIRKYGLEDSFILLGSLANPYPVMRAADIYVQTSRYEGYCLTLTEARILNLPCVTTRFDVVNDQMIDGENGLIVDMTPKAVADGIIRLIQNSDLYAYIQKFQQAEKKGNEEEIHKVYNLIEGKQL